MGVQLSLSLSLSLSAPRSTTPHAASSVPSSDSPALLAQLAHPPKPELAVTQVEREKSSLPTATILLLPPQPSPNRSIEALAAADPDLIPSTQLGPLQIRKACSTNADHSPTLLQLDMVATIHSLAPETLIHIFEGFSPSTTNHNSRSICSFALVCRAWRDPAQVVLFTSVRLRGTGYHDDPFIISDSLPATGIHSQRFTTFVELRQRLGFRVARRVAAHSAASMALLAGECTVLNATPQG